MTKILHRDPDRRCKTLDEWPALDRALWQAALVPGDVLEDGGSRAKHSEFSNRNAVYGYGRWLTWLDRRGLLDATDSPADRIIPARVKAYIDDLEQHNATQTLLNRLQELHAVAVVMDPDRDWSWIYRIYSQVKARHRPARPKLARLVPAGELFELGVDLMIGAGRRNTAVQRAMTFRDGLIIALLAARPLRIRNLTSLVLDHTLVSRGTQWWIEFSAVDTKNEEVIEQPWPEALTAPLETYLAHHRDVLVQTRRDSTRPAGKALWVARGGSPLSRQEIYHCITMRTREGLRRPINPQLFRDCATTSIARDDPDHIGIAWRLLGHRTPTTAEKYYNQARSVEASRRLQNFLLSLR
jgi:site-specific recombinase XerD